MVRVASLRHLPKLFYPNYLNLSFFTKNWGMFFSEEDYNLSALIGVVFLWHCLVGGFAVWSVAKHVAIVIGIRRFLAGGLCSSTKKLTGQTVIITGANIGIGLETARDMVRRGARVIMACRDLKKAEATRAELVKEGPGTAEIRKLDLSNFVSVREFANGIVKDNIKVHILINNAGVLTNNYSETSDGFELHMATNHLGPFLLTNLLLPQMKHGEPARIVNVSSLFHVCGRINFEDINDKAHFDGLMTYSNTKFANILFTRQLATILKGSNIQVFSLHPGGVFTAIDRNVSNPGFARNLKSLFFKTCREGAQTSIYCATDAVQHEDMYFSDCAVGWVADEAKDDASAERLWKYSTELVKLNK